MKSARILENENTGAQGDKADSIGNPRQRRVLAALLRGPVTRNEADAIAHASNGPDVVLKLRERGLRIETTRVDCVDADGKRSFFGRYWLADADKRRARELLEGAE